MATWLTYLKSRLLLPKEEKSDDHTPEELEEALYKLGEWAFAEDYCDPMEVQRAKQISSI